MTREQVGIALEYENPSQSIKNIHSRNRDRLDRFSGGVKLTPPENRTNSRGSGSGPQFTTIYTLRGVMEICRLSRQPKADAFMDFCPHRSDSRIIRQSEPHRRRILSRKRPRRHQDRPARIAQACSTQLQRPGLAHEQNIKTAPDPPEQPASPHQTANIPRPPVLPYPPGRKLNNNIYFESGLLKSTESNQKQTYYRYSQRHLNPTESGTV